VLQRVRSIPGIGAAAITSRIDVAQPGLGYMVLPEGVPDTPATRAGARGRSISPGYLELLGIPVMRGRDFDAHDTTSSSKVMLVNESFARRFFPGQDPIGKHVTSADHIVCEIVGVVRNVRCTLQSAGANDEFYLPLEQRPWATARLLIRSRNTAAVLPSVRRQVQSVDHRAGGRRDAAARRRPLRFASPAALHHDRPGGLRRCRAVARRHGNLWSDGL
jgi:hypothetical protein